MSEFEFKNKGYGKYWVKLLHRDRNGSTHSIKEYEVSTLITLDSDKDYLQGDNSDIVATDSQKNTVYLLAKKHGVGNPEQFAMLVAKHFIQTYSWVNRAEVKVEALNWKRVRGDHVHAFIAEPTFTRWAKAIIDGKHGEPKVTAGLNGLRLLKTTKSGFVNFVQDGYRSLPDQVDRIFSTIVEANWTYHTINGLLFCKSFNKIIDIIIDNFAGPNTTGKNSSSVQQTMYETQVQALQTIPQMNEIFMAMPNKHYFNVDLSKFPRSVGGCEDNEDVFLPIDKPAGYIEATLGRKQLTAKL